MNLSGNNAEKRGYLLLIFSISLAIFMSSLDGTIVNIALPTISESFGISTSAVSWVSTTYYLVLTGCLLIFGKISDSIGFKRVFLTGFVVFTMGSFACGFIPDLLGSYHSLVGSRVFQGIGGAMISAIAPAMVYAFIPNEQKAKAMGIVMTVASVGMALGPTLGGILTQYLSWHWIFFINVPIGIFAVILGAKVIPDTKGDGSLEGFDKSGAFLIFAGLAFLLFFFSEGAVLGWTSPVILVSLAGAVIFLGAFVWQEARAKMPVLEFSLFKSRNFVFMNLALMFAFFSYGGINYLLPFYIEYVMGFDTSMSGFIMTIFSVALMISGLLGGFLYNRTGGKILIVVAAFVMVIGYMMMSMLHAATGLVFVGVCLFLIGFGMGLLTTPMFSLIMNSVSRNYQGMVSSLTGLERFAPVTIGIAFFNCIFIQGVRTIANETGITSGAPAAVEASVLASGFDMAFFVGLILSITVLALSLFIKQEVHQDYLEKGGWR